MISSLILITLLCLIANIIGTVSGFGVGTVMTPILLFFLPFDQTVLFICVIHWFHDVARVIFFRTAINWILFRNFGIPTIIATFFGALLVTPGQSTILTSLLGFFLIISVVGMFLTDYITLPTSLTMDIIGGLLSGFFAGIFGIRGAVRSVFLVSFDLRKEAFIGTTAAISLALDSVRWITYLGNGLKLSTEYYQGMVIFIPISFFGVYLGHVIVQRISEKEFKYLVAIFLFIVGLRFLVAPWF